MRIISGSAKGRRLAGPAHSKKGSHIRPTSDRAREALFNIIGPDRTLNSAVLDLFAGTGALGLEALSRGASFAHFVDNCSSAIKIIQQNISLCGFLSRSAVVKRDLEKGLFFFADGLEGQTADQAKNYFDLVFIDPPYDQGKCEYLLSEIQKYDLVNDESLIVYEDRSRQKIPSFVGSLTLFDQRKYGDTGFWFFKK